MAACARLATPSMPTTTMNDRKIIDIPRPCTSSFCSSGPAVIRPHGMMPVVHMTMAATRAIHGHHLRHGGRSAR